MTKRELNTLIRDFTDNVEPKFATQQREAIWVLATDIALAMEATFKETVMVDTYEFAHPDFKIFIHRWKQVMFAIRCLPELYPLIKAGKRAGFFVKVNVSDSVNVRLFRLPMYDPHNFTHYFHSVAEFRVFAEAWKEGYDAFLTDGGK